MSKLLSSSLSLYEINTRNWLRDLSKKLERPITLGNIPDSELDQLSNFGITWVWLLGIWRTGEEGRKIAKDHPELQGEYLEILPDLDESDICSSPFAITGYSVSPDLGGNHGLSILRENLHAHGIKLMLDFIPNHTAIDHPWVTLHPDFYIHGTEEQLVTEPYNYARKPKGEKIFAYGRDPYFPGWSDTFQLNYGNSELNEAMREELINVAELCDGVRCDMAMLLLPEVFCKTWGVEIEPFWPTAIVEVKSRFPKFTLMAEVYWDLEWELQKQGFDYTYDKRLYDRLLQHEARPVREHLMAGSDFQNKSVRFLENHDEPRAAMAFPSNVHQAAAIITYLVPGLKFFHQGQLQGFLKRIPMQLCKTPKERPDPELGDFYQRLLEILRLPILNEGNWKLLECLPAWGSNWTWDNYIAFAWGDFSQESLLVVVNFAPHQGQCYVRLPGANFHHQDILLKDVMSGIQYIRKGDDLSQYGLFLDMPGWNFHVFEVSRQ